MGKVSHFKTPKINILRGFNLQKISLKRFFFFFFLGEKRIGFLVLEKVLKGKRIKEKSIDIHISFENVPIKGENKNSRGF